MSFYREIVCCLCCLQALQAQLAALEGGRCELSELRSCAYAAVHRVRQALAEHGAAPAAALPEGSEPGAAPQQLKLAVDELLTMLQVGKRRFSLHPVAVLPDKCCC